MTTEAREYGTDLFLMNRGAGSDCANEGFERRKQGLDDSFLQLVDNHPQEGAQISYFRLNPRNLPTTVYISKSGTISRALESSEVGLLLSVCRENKRYTVWLPRAPEDFHFDQYRRIARSEASFISYHWQLQPSIGLNIVASKEANQVVVFPCVVMEDADYRFFEELSYLSDVERRLYRKSNWFYANKPSDIWNCLIDGSVYHPHARRRVGKRFRCQQCAYAWWNYLGFLQKETDKKIYEVLQNEVAHSVLLDLSDEGEWGHGFWSDEIETHARFHLDGVHLLLSQYEKTHEPIWVEAAERAMAFVFKHLMEELDDGSVWFLHDTIEDAQGHHFESTIFGKTAGNSLCINTHVQALTVLHRMGIAVRNKGIYGSMFNKGMQALNRVLHYQPGEALYKSLLFWTMKVKRQKQSHSLWVRLNNRFQRRVNRYVPIMYWFVRRRFPRLVQPGGFTERDLTLSFVYDGYHIVNVKDFLTLYQQEPVSWLRRYIEDGIAFVRKNIDFSNRILRDPLYIEWIDILYLYDKLFEHVSCDEMRSAKREIYQSTGGYSLDYYAAELVRHCDTPVTVPWEKERKK